MAISNDSNLSRFLLDPPFRKVLIVVFSIGVSLGTGVMHGITQSNTYTQQALDKQLVTLVEYERIGKGMTITDVRAIIGNGTEISQSGSIVKVAWTNHDGSRIVATFQDGILIGKEQSGL